VLDSAPVLREFLKSAKGADGRIEMKVARFITASKELFYFVSGLQMIRRHCESQEEAKRILECCGFPQTLIVT
jgi:hypothetical protein